MEYTDFRKSIKLPIAFKTENVKIFPIYFLHFFKITLFHNTFLLFIFMKDVLNISILMVSVTESYQVWLLIYRVLSCSFVVG